MRSEPTRLLAAVALACSTLAPVARAAIPDPDGPQFVVATLDYNTGGGVETDSDGNMIVSWNFLFGGPGGRSFSNAGNPGPFFTIEPYGGLITSDPMDSTVPANNDFAFVWEGGSGPAGAAVRHPRNAARPGGTGDPRRRRFLRSRADGFESGDTSAWSATVP